MHAPALLPAILDIPEIAAGDGVSPHHIAQWAAVFRDDAVPQRLILAVPWRALPSDRAQLPLHVRVERALVGCIAREAQDTRRADRLVPVLLDVNVIRRATIPVGFDAATDLAELIAHADGWAGYDVRYRYAVREHLCNGRLLLVLAGFADVDHQRDFLADDKADHLATLLRAAAVRRVLIVARGSGRTDCDADCSVARREVLGDAFAIRWAHSLAEPAAGDTVRQFARSWPVQPLLHTMSGMLTDPDGPVYGQLLPLRQTLLRFPEYRGRWLAAALSFLVLGAPSGADTAPLPSAGMAEVRAALGDPPVTPRVPLRLLSTDLGLVARGEAWDEGRLAGFLAARNGAGAVIVDDIGAGEGYVPGGGWGKTTLLLTLFAEAYRQGRPAVYLSLSDLNARLWADSRRAPLRLLELALLAEDCADGALVAQIGSRGLLVALDGLESLGASPRHPSLPGLVARALAGEESGVRMIAACRAEPWLATAGGGRGADGDLPFAAELHRLLGRESGHSGTPLCFLATGLDVAGAGAYLRKVHPQGARLLTALGRDGEVILKHPIALGALAVLPDVDRDASQATHADALPDLLAAAVRGFLRRPIEVVTLGIAGAVPSGESTALAERDWERLTALALAAAEQGGSLSDGWATDVLVEVAVAAAKQEAYATAGELLRRIRNRVDLGQPQEQVVQEEVMATLQSRTETTTRQSAVGVLTGLAAASLVLCREAQQRYAFSHDLFRDVLGSDALQRLDREDPPRAARVRWLLNDRGSRSLVDLADAEALREWVAGGGSLRSFLSCREARADVVQYLALASLRALLPDALWGRQGGDIALGRWRDAVIAAVARRDPDVLMQTLPELLDNSDSQSRAVSAIQCLAESAPNRLLAWVRSAESEPVAPRLEEPLRRAAPELFAREAEAVVAWLDEALATPQPEGHGLLAAAVVVGAAQQLADRDPDRLLAWLPALCRLHWGPLRKIAIYELSRVALALARRAPQALVRRIAAEYRDAEAERDVRAGLADALGAAASFLVRDAREDFNAALAILNEGDRRRVEQNPVHALSDAPGDMPSLPPAPEDWPMIADSVEAALILAELERQLAMPEGEATTRRMAARRLAAIAPALAHYCPEPLAVLLNQTLTTTDDRELRWRVEQALRRAVPHLQRAVVDCLVAAALR